MHSANSRLKINTKFLVVLAVVAIVASLVGCSGNSTSGANSGMNLVGAKVAGFTAVDQYLHDHPDRVGAVDAKITQAEAILTAGTGTYDDLQALLFASIATDPRRQFYFGVVFDLIEPQIGVGNHGALIKPGSTADLMIRAALAGAKQALLIDRSQHN